MALILESGILRTIRAHGEETYPHECCGFMLGAIEGDRKVVTEVRRAGNTRHDSPHNRYQISPEESFAMEKEASSRGIAIVGIYHSHPDHPAIPSETDREHACPWYSYLIVPVAKGTATDARTWVLDGPGFVEETLSSNA